MAEQMIPLQVELLPEGFYLTTSDAIPGLVAQGRTVMETLEIARDVASRLLEARAERGEPIPSLPIADRFEMPLGFAFDRQAAGSHEIWYRTEDQRYTGCPMV
jgi:predicted RNase H-like HicB family nuclease